VRCGRHVHAPLQTSVRRPCYKVTGRALLCGGLADYARENAVLRGGVVWLPGIGGGGCKALKTDGVVKQRAYAGSGAYGEKVRREAIASHAPARLQR